MAESLNVIFADASFEQIAAWLDNKIGKSRTQSWAWPIEDYAVLIYEWRDFFKELDPLEVGRLRQMMKRQSSCALIVELRRSKGRAAFDVGASLAHKLLFDFQGVVLSVSGDTFWTLDDVSSGAATREAEKLWPSP